MLGRIARFFDDEFEHKWLVKRIEERETFERKLRIKRIECETAHLRDQIADLEMKLQNLDTKLRELLDRFTRPYEGESILGLSCLGYSKFGNCLSDERKPDARYLDLLYYLEKEDYLRERNHVKDELNDLSKELDLKKRGDDPFGITVLDIARTMDVLIDRSHSYRCFGRFRQDLDTNARFIIWRFLSNCRDEELEPMHTVACIDRLPPSPQLVQKSAHLNSNPNQQRPIISTTCLRC